MFRSLALSLAAVFAFTANASADVFVGTGTIQTGPATTALDVNVVNGNTSLGIQFINNITTNAVPQGTVNTIGSNLLSTYGFRTGGGIPAMFGNQQVVAVFASQGTLAAGGPQGNLFTAQNITAALYAIPSGTYNQFNPATWGTAGPPIATFTMRPNEQVNDFGPANVMGGGPGIFNLAPNQTNQIGINLTVGSSNQGFFLLNEATNPNFWNITGNAGLLGGLSEGIVTRIDESLVVADTVNTAGVDSAGEIALLNTIFNTLLPGVSPFGFATGFGGLGNPGGAASSFNPSTGNPGPNTGDVVFTFGTTTSLFTTFQQNGEIPEPATLAVFAGMMGLGGLVYRKRRNAKVMA